MEKTVAQRWAYLLKIFVRILFVCNIIALFLVPAIVMLSPNSLFLAMEEQLLHLLHVRPFGEDDICIPTIMVAFAARGEMFRYPVKLLYSLFLLVCGSCSLVILHQAKRILETILEGNPFQITNAHSMKRAAIGCWTITFMAALRLALELIWMKNTHPIYTYNALFIPVSLTAGLLFLVMSALFRQAAELQEDQDLTI